MLLHVHVLRLLFVGRESGSGVLLFCMLVLFYNIHVNKMFKYSSNVNKDSIDVNKLIIIHLNTVKQFVPQVIKLWHKIFKYELLT